MNGNKSKTQTIEVIDTRSRHTAKDIKGMIVDSLKRFDIPLENVLLSVTDNATNMVKSIQLLNEVNTSGILMINVYI